MLESRLLLSYMFPLVQFPIKTATPSTKGAAKPHAAAAAPAAPSQVSASTLSANSVHLTWADNSNNETGFQILRRTGTSGGFQPIAKVGTNVKSFNDNKLSASTRYFYEVVALDGSVTSAVSNVATALTKGPPAAPASLKAVALSTNQVQLNWADLSNNETGFRIYDHVGTSKAWTLVSQVAANATSFVVSNLLPATSYAFEVMAVAPGYVSAPTNTATATTATLAAQALTPTSIQLTWAATSTKDTGYVIQRKVAGTSTWTTVKSLSKSLAQRPHATTGAPFGYTDTNLQPNTHYLYQIVSQNGGTKAASSNTVVVSTLSTAAPASDLAATPLSTSSVQLTWSDNSNNESGFEILRQTGDSGTWDVVSVASPDTTSFMDTGLSAGTSYAYEVVTVLGTATSAPSNQATATVFQDTSAPVAAGSLSATPASTSTIQLTWADNSSNETGFQIVRQTANSGTWQVVTTVGPNVSNYSDWGLQANTAYSYEIVAVNGNIPAPASNVAATTTLASNTPGTISVSVNTVASNSLALSWTTTNVTENGFQIQRADNNSGIWHSVAVLSGSTLNFTDTTVQPGTAYAYQVLSTNNGAISSISTVITGTTSPAAPTALTATQLTTTSIQLNWADASAIETGFTVLRKSGNGGWTAIQTVGKGVMTYTDTNLQPNVTYSYEVIAINGNAVSAPSNTASSTTLTTPNAASGLVTSVLPSSQVLLSWTDNSSTETGFKISRSTDGVHFSSITTVGANSTNFTDTTVSALTTYYYLVVATNAAGDASPSNMASATTLSSVAGVTLDANGWTQITAPSDAHIIYVSSSQGNDANNGLSPSTPVQTLQAGYNLLRDGTADELLLKAGDTWNTPLGLIISSSMTRWGKGGRSASEPMVISSYGSGARPIVNSGSMDGFDIAGGTIGNIALIGIQFQGSGATGIWFYDSGSNFLVENCLVKGYVDNMDIMSGNPGPGVVPLSNVTVRRSVIEYSAGVGKSQGIYSYGVVNLTLDGNLFYHNGWSADGTTVPLSIRSHDVYTDASKNLVAKNNIFADASSFGLTVSGDNTGDTVNPDIENNLFVGDTNSLTFGAGSPNAINGGVIRGNVFTEIGRTVQGATQAYGIDIGSSSNMLVENNYFFNKSVGGTTFLIHLGDQSGYSNITIRNNVANNWAGGYIWINSANLQNVQVTGNVLQDSVYASPVEEINSTTPNPQLVYSNNTYYSNANPSSWFSLNSGATFSSLAQWVAASGETGAATGPVQFTNSNVTVGSYAALLGLGSTSEDFLNAALNQSKTNWQTQLTAQSILAYLKAGFTIVP